MSRVNDYCRARDFEDCVVIAIGEALFIELWLQGSWLGGLTTAWSYCVMPCEMCFMVSLAVAATARVRRHWLDLLIELDSHATQLDRNNFQSGNPACADKRTS